jgi:hypothetical protein
MGGAARLRVALAGIRDFGTPWRTSWARSTCIYRLFFVCFQRFDVFASDLCNA